MPTAKILVVDDQPINVQLLKRKLEREKLEVLTANNGLEALEQVRVHKPDLILLDLMMPDMDGMEVCQRLQASSETRSIPVIFVTARSTKESTVSYTHLDVYKRQSHCHAAVNGKNLAGHISRLLGAQVGAHVGDIGRLPESLQRNELQNLFREFGLGHEFVRHVRLYKARSHRINGDAAGSEFAGQRLGEADHARLCGRVVGLTCVSHDAAHRGDVDDPSPAGAGHGAGQVLGPCLLYTSRCV